MKNLLFLSCLIAFFLPGSLLATSETPVRIESKIDAVTVFMSGAEVTRSASQALNGGRSTLVFTGLSSQVNASSIRIKSSGQVKILSMNYGVNYLKQTQVDERIRKVEDSLQVLKHKIQDIQDEKNAYTEEKDFILKNKSIGGADKGVPVYELKETADFYRSRIKEINQALTRLNRQEVELNKSNSRLLKQRNESNARRRLPTYEITVKVSSEKPISSRFELRYLTNGSGWAPKYDIRAENVNSDMLLEYRAQVFNQSGIDWPHVNLTLSTAEPSVSQERPILQPWGLNYNQGYGEYEGRVNPFAVKGKKDMDKESAKSEETIEGVELSEISVSELSVDYEISEPYTLPADGKPYLVDIRELTVPAVFNYYSVPKMDKSAFLIAKIPDWERINLVEGPVNIYYANTFIGQSYFNTRYANDTLELSMGRDKKVIISRTKREDISSKKIIGTHSKEQFQYEINIKNTNQTAIRIEVLDQVPISQESDIEVRILDQGGAKLEEQSGKLTWDLTLGPGESKKFNFSYYVKYPKNKNLILRKSRKVYSPRFMMQLFAPETLQLQ